MCKTYDISKMLSECSLNFYKLADLNKDVEQNIAHNAVKVL